MHFEDSRNKIEKKQVQSAKMIEHRNFSKPIQVPFAYHMYATSKTTLCVATPDAAEKL